MNDTDAVSKQNQEHSNNLLKLLADPELRKLAETWFATDTVDAWRHHRMYSYLDPLLASCPGSRWLTVGDSHFGKDAHYIQEKGHRVMATDIADPLLKIGAERGLIREFKTANAEALCFPDESFDFVLCKESYHHFRRPMVAVYEMLRVARQGIVLIEPNEAPRIGSFRFMIKRLLKRVLLRLGMAGSFQTQETGFFEPYLNSWEDVGNYVYTISERELEKVALGMGYAACAFKGLNDYYEKGVEFQKATPDSEIFRRVRQRIADADRSSRRNGCYRLLVAVIFKEPPNQNAIKLMQEAGFTFKALPSNPYGRRA